MAAINKKEEKPKVKQYYDVRVLSLVQADLTYRVLAETPQQAAELIKNIVGGSFIAKDTAEIDPTEMTNCNPLTEMEEVKERLNKIEKMLEKLLGSK